MNDDIKFRTCKKLADGKWLDVEFEDLEDGDTFRLFEDGAQIVEAVAGSAPYPIEPDGNFQIFAKEVKS